MLFSFFLKEKLYELTLPAKFFIMSSTLRYSKRGKGKDVKRMNTKVPALGVAQRDGKV